MELIYVNADKSKDENGWVLDTQFLKRIQDSLEGRGLLLNYEDIEIVLLTATGEDHLIDT